MSEQTLLAEAKAGDIRAFHSLFAKFQPQLKSYLYRLVANRNDMEDLAQDVFIIAFEQIGSFRGEALLKSWVFTIATNRARRHLKKRNRWETDTLEKAREYAYAEPGVLELVDQTHRFSPHGAYELREHIDYCFTCVSQMLPLKQQIALILKDVYGFKNKEIAEIMSLSLSQSKHLLYGARQTMIKIFDDTCALISKHGVCNQCSQLNGRFNPKQEQQTERMKIKWVKHRENHTHQELYHLRAELVRGIDPLQGEGADLHELFLKINHTVNEPAN